MIRFQNFVSSRSCVQNPYAQLHHFAGIKSATLTFYSTLRELWQMCYLMDKKQFWKKGASVYSFNQRANYMFIHVSLNIIL